MIINRNLRWLARLQHAFFVMCLSVPTYVSAVRVMTDRGLVLTWYDRAGVGAVCLLLVWGVTLLPGLLVLAISAAMRIARRRTSSSKLQAPPGGWPKGW